MNICGVLVHTFPDKVASVAAEVARIPGSQLHGSTDDGRLIVTIEDTDKGTALDSLASLHSLSGVVAAALVYHHFEPVHDETGAQDTEA